MWVAGGFGHKDENFVEYDLDENDREWLENFNKGQDRLPPRRFELLIWRLELINAEANERHSTAAGDVRFISPSHFFKYPRCTNQSLRTCMRSYIFGTSLQLAILSHMPSSETRYH